MIALNMSTPTKTKRATKPAKELKTETIFFRVTPAESATITKLATKDGITPGQWARVATLRRAAGGARG